MRRKVSKPERVDDPDVGDNAVPIAYRDVTQRIDVEVRRLIIDQLAVQSAVLADPDVTEVEVLAVASVRRRDAVARVRRVGEISTSGAVQARLSRARVEAGAPFAVISCRACAEELTSG